MADPDRTASLMTPSKLAQVQTRTPASPAAWLNQMAADAGHAHVRRLAELRTELQAQALRRDVSPLASELSQLGKALPRLDFGLLQPLGWWARLTGKGRSAGAQFAQQFDLVDEATRGVATEAQALQKRQLEQAGQGDRAMVELEVEFRAIERIMEQGARWLHDMRNQLKARQAAAADEPSRQQIKADAARCEILNERLKALRGVSSAAQKVHREAQALAGRRAALLQMLQQMLGADIKAWRTRLSTLAAAAAGDSAPPPASLEAPGEAHRELQLCVKQALADCAQLQGQEKALAESLGALGMQLDVVA